MPPLWMFPPSAHLRARKHVLWGLAMAGLVMASARSEVRLNELVAAPKERRLATDAHGRLRPGTGLMWTDPDFSAPGWKTGTAPLGFGGTGLGTNLQSLMQRRTPTLYLRKTFTATADDLANTGTLRLRVNFDDGFVAYLNGREAGRTNCGPVGHFLYHDQPAYNFATATTNGQYSPPSQPGVGGTQPRTVALGSVANWLVAGTNVLALELHNRDPDVSARIDATLEVVLGNAVYELARDDFNTGNGATQTHHNAGGSISDTTTGTPPAGSWLAAAPPPQSAGAWEDLTMTTTMVPPSSGGATGALRYMYSQTGTDQPAAFFGPAVALAPRLAPGTLTTGMLGDLAVSFRFRASSNLSLGLRLDPAAGATADSLAGLPALTPTAGTGVIEAVPNAFADVLGGSRTRTVNASGTAATTTSGALRYTTTLFSGPAMRDFALRVTEDNTAGAGAGGSTGLFACEVTQEATQSDFFGFSAQPWQVKSWTAGNTAASQLGAVQLQFDSLLPAGTVMRVSLEPATTTAGYNERLDLGLITGTGAWASAEINPATGTNQTTFLNAMNAANTTSVRVAFRSEAPWPLGAQLKVDNVGFVPWRTYTATLAAGTNAAAFVAAINAQENPRVFPVFEKTGTALAPLSAWVVIDDFVVTYTQPNSGTPVTFVPLASTGWTYFPGLTEPSGGLVEPADFTTVGAEKGFADWVELFNDGADAVSLAGWSLTDERDTPHKWAFPAGTSIAPGAGLVVLLDDRAVPPAAAAWLHAGFSLQDDGEYLALVDPAGAVRDALDPGYPRQNPFHSYGRDPGGSGAWGFLREATPGLPNSGPWFPGKIDTPDFSPAGGFFTGNVSLTLTCQTSGASIRYSFDGTEPTETSGIPYTGPITLVALSDKSGPVVRARAFLDGLVPSETRTHTYLINQNANLKRAPAVLLSGDPGRVFYKPLGILAIQGGAYYSGTGDGSKDELWYPTAATDYNMPMGGGRLVDGLAAWQPYERPVQVEFIYSDGREGFREEAGVRVSSSPYSRPRLRLTQAATASPWAADHVQKPSLNIFFRNEYGASSVNFPLIPETEVRKFEEFRLRAGKNDITNPFIRDEFVRRLFTDMGHVGTVGTFTTVYLNGVYKGYYNLCERLREAFMQTHHHSDLQWDVNYIGTFEDGDATHWNTVLTPRLTASLTQKANYDALASTLDLTNAADYYLLMVYAAMWDWPGNNWAMARERSPGGLWRYYVWDAEGGFGLYGNKPVSYNIFTNDLLNGGGTLALNFQRLKNSPEFRLLFADRINRHLFNGGALTDAVLTARKNACQAEVQPLMAQAGITTPDQSWFSTWLNATSGRRSYLLPKKLPGETGYAAGQFRDPNGDGNLADTLWPLTPPPVFSQSGGLVDAGFALGMTHSAPVGSTLYYTLDGSDPRLWGGATSAAALTFADPVPLTASSVTVKARVKNLTTGEWSPLTEALFRVGTVPASPSNLVVGELMYHPPAPTVSELAAGFADADEFEYLALQNIGGAPVDVSGLRFSEGISFDFATALRTVVDPGQRLVVGRNRSALRQRYGAAAVDAVFAGEFFGGLGNGGEALRLETTIGAGVIRAFTYLDTSPWPVAADGAGPSLLLVDPASNPNHNEAASWTASAAVGGQAPGSAPALSYAGWTAWTFPTAELAIAAISGPLADADADGWPNLLEWALVGAARDPGRTPQVDFIVTPLPDGSRQLDLSFDRRPGLSGVTLTPQSSGGLSGWIAGFTQVSQFAAPDGSVRETWRTTAPAGTTPLFGRVRAAIP